ncbi:MAG: phosphoribosylglycinamide formyltransferase 1 [Chloroflexota bacterium]|nr:phosphoribosylglycinamide formyltransferase 1 [Chloroflexota bacterium]
MTRLGVLVSGRGSNLGAILAACGGGGVDGEVVAVLANRECPALEIARQHGVSLIRVFGLAEHGDAAARDRAMAAALQRAGVDLVLCAGYDRILSDDFVRRFDGRILNVHPSLLPAYGGTMTAIADALAGGGAETGVTIHYVEPDTVDAGTIVAQAAVPIVPGDTVESLAERVHATEHRLFPEAIQAWIEGRLPQPAGMAPVPRERAGKPEDGE